MTTMENRLEFATLNKHRPPAAPASRRTHVCDTCNLADADCSRVVREFRGSEVRLMLCQTCLVKHVIRRQDRARLDVATEARQQLDATAARQRGGSAVSTGRDWRAQTAALRRQTEALARRPASHSQQARRAGAR